MYLYVHCVINETQIRRSVTVCEDGIYELCANNGLKYEYIKRIFRWP